MREATFQLLAYNTPISHLNFFSDEKSTPRATQLLKTNEFLVPKTDCQKSQKCQGVLGYRLPWIDEQKKMKRHD